MSVVDREQVKIVLDRHGADPLWQQLLTHFAEDDVLRWKYLAMLALREDAGWPLHAIGCVFDHPKGHVSRCLTRIKQLIRDECSIAESAVERNAA